MEIIDILDYAMLYTGLLSLSLYYFAFYHICGLIMNNKTTNEDLRSRWNGDTVNKERVEVYRQNTSFCKILKHLFCGPKHPSKLAKLSNLLYLYKSLGENPKLNLTSVN